MSLLAPAAAFFGLTVPAIVALYFLRVRRTAVPVSSTMLWRPMVRDRQASVPWQRLRVSWLLILQVLAALALVLALMRPAQSAPAPLAPHTILALDVSAPMQATDVKPSRFAAAVARAGNLIDRMTATDRLTVVALSSDPRVVADDVGDKGALHRALDALQPENTEADLQGTLALAASISGAETNTELVILSDGVTLPVDATVSLPFRVSYQPIGATGENLAITALSAEAATGSGTTGNPATGQQAFVHVQNFGTQAHATTLDLTVDGTLTDEKAITLPAGAGDDLTFPLPPGATRLEASLTPHDAFALDDTGWALARPPGGYRTLLVTSGNTFLQQALALIPGIQVTTVTATAAAYDAATAPAQGGPAALYVFDGFVPATLPEAPVLLIDPTSGAAGTIGDAFNPGVLGPASTDPLIAGINLAAVHVDASHDLTKDAFGSPLITSQGGPVVLLRQQPIRGVLFGFNLHQSDLPLQSAFPVLMSRLVDWLVPQASAPSYSPGDQVPVSESGPGFEVARPDRHTDPLPAGTTAFLDTQKTGIYTIRSTGGAAAGGAGEVTGTARAGTVATFAINRFSANTFSIAPQGQLNLAGTTVEAGSSGPHPRQEDEWWPWAAGAALVLLSAEWLVFHRGL